MGSYRCRKWVQRFIVTCLCNENKYKRSCGHIVTARHYRYEMRQDWFLHFWIHCLQLDILDNILTEIPPNDGNLSLATEYFNPWQCQQIKGGRSWAPYYFFLNMWPGITHCTLKYTRGERAMFQTHKLTCKLRLHYGASVWSMQSMCLGQKLIWPWCVFNLNTRFVYSEYIGYICPLSQEVLHEWINCTSTAVQKHARHKKNWLRTAFTLTELIAWQLSNWKFRSSAWRTVHLCS